MLHTVLLLFCIKSEIVHMFMTVQGSAFHSHFTVKNVGKKMIFNLLVHFNIYKHH